MSNLLLVEGGEHEVWIFLVVKGLGMLDPLGMKVQVIGACACFIFCPGFFQTFRGHILFAPKPP